MKPTLSRRNFLKPGVLAAALPLPALAGPALASAERRLGFHNLHTGEQAELLDRRQLCAGSAQRNQPHTA